MSGMRNRQDWFRVLGGRELKVGALARGPVLLLCWIMAASILWIAGCKGGVVPHAFNIELGHNSVSNRAVQSIADKNGNTYIVGKAQSSLFNSAKSDTNFGGFLAKFDPYGNLLWGVQLNSPGKDVSVNSVALQGDSVYIVGDTSGTISGVETPDYRDGFVARYDAEGGLTWLKLISAATPGPTAAVHVAKIVFNSENIAYLTGSSSNGVAFDGKTAAKIGETDGFLLAMTMAGEISGEIKMIGGTTGAQRNSISITGLTLDDADNVYVSGATTVSLFDQPLTGVGDAFIARFSGSLELAWAKLFGVAAAMVIATDLAYSHSNQAIYVGGYGTASQTGGDFSGSRLPYVASFAAADGAQNWLKEAPAQDHRNENIAVAVDNHANLVAVGYAEIDIYNSGHTAMFNDATIVKYNSAGNLLGGQQFGCNQSDSAAVYWGINIVRDRVFVVGSSTFGLEEYNPMPVPQSGFGSFAIFKTYTTF